MAKALAQRVLSGAETLQVGSGGLPDFLARLSASVKRATHDCRPGGEGIVAVALRTGMCLRARQPLSSGVCAVMAQCVAVSGRGGSSRSASPAP